MAANGISTLLTKELRQKSKLDSAALKRAADGNPRATYDITRLPSQYDNNSVINNPNPTGLVSGRPWILTEPAFTFYEAINTTSALEIIKIVSGNKIYAYSSSWDVPDYENARVEVNDVEVLNTDGRGHHLVILDTFGNLVSATRYDTFETVPLSADGGAPARAALLAALDGVASGNIIVLVVYDASSLDAAIRTSLQNNYGSTNNNTWTSSRVDHIFIGIRV
jgi:hypothetical protein